MTTKLKVLSQITDLKKSLRFLFPDIFQKDDISGPPETHDGALGWESDWGWEDVEFQGNAANGNAIRTNNDTKEGNQTLNLIIESLECVFISISPFSDVIVFANDLHLVILSLKYSTSVVTPQVGNKYTIDKGDTTTMTPEYQEIYRGQPHWTHDNSPITAVKCIPLSSLRKSNCGTPDWTCVVVGFANGYVRFYAENGSEILSQRFHDSPVKQIKMRSFEPARYGLDEEQAEELSILYNDLLIAAEGFSLFQTLRACRSQLARTGQSIAGKDNAQQQPLLTFKKWKLNGQAGLGDHASGGVHSASVFDRLVHKSLSDGVNGRVSVNRVRHSRYVVAGKESYVSVYLANEEGSTLGIGDIASAVASKMKNVLISATGLSSWFGSGGQTTSSSSSGSQQYHSGNQNAERAALDQVPIGLSVAYGLADSLRIGCSIEVSPDFKLAAITDTLGRVVLMDIAAGVAIRMWKGYREAQIQFIQCWELTSGRSDGNASDSPNRSVRSRVTYLCIHAPRRCIIEVWALRFGPRVAAFNVPRGTRLIPASYKMAGLNNANYDWLDNMSNFHSFFLLDPNGVISIVEIPYHLALTSGNSHRTFDHQLLRLIRGLLKSQCDSEDNVCDEICDAVSQFRLVGCLEMALTRIFATKYLTGTFILRVLNHILYLLANGSLCPQSTKQEKKRLESYTEVYKILFETYNDLQATLRLPPGHEVCEVLVESEFAPPPVNVQNLSDLMALEVADAEQCIHLHNVCRQMASRMKLLQVNNNFPLLLPSEITPLEFIDWFSCTSHGLTEDDDYTVSVELSTATLNKPRRCARMGRFFFEAYVEDFLDLETLEAILRSSHISPQILLRVFTAWYLSTDRFQLQHLDRVKKLLQSLIKAILNQENFTSNNLVSGFVACDTADLLDNLLNTNSSLIHTSSGEAPHLFDEDVSPLTKRPCINSISTSVGENVNNATCSSSSSDQLPASWDQLAMLLSECRTLHCFTSSALTSVFHLSMIWRALLAELITSSPPSSQTKCQSDVSPLARSISSGGQSALQNEVDQWHILCTRLEDLLWFRLLLQLTKSDLILTNTKNLLDHQQESNQSFPAIHELTVGKVMESGTGFLQELFARWIVHIQLDVEDLNRLYVSLGQGLVDVDSRTIMDTEHASTIAESIFKEVYKNLPHTLEYDAVLVNIAWEYLIAWTKKLEIADHIGRCVSYLNAVGTGSAMVVLGTQSMMWDMHWMKRVQSITYVIQRQSTHLPHSRECREEFSMSQSVVMQFLQHSVAFMKLFIKSLQNAEVVPAFGCESHWRDVISARLSLVELAVERPPVSHYLLEHHLQLLLVLHATFSLRIERPIIKPLALFDVVGIQCFFGSLSSTILHPPSHSSSSALWQIVGLPISSGVDSVFMSQQHAAQQVKQSSSAEETKLTINTKIEKLRMEFTRRVIQQAVNLFVKSEETSGGEEEIDEANHCNDQLYQDGIKIALHLATSWNLSVMQLRRYHVLLLFLMGKDEQAFLFADSVEQHSELSQDLMTLVGQRLAILCCEGLGEPVSSSYRVLMTPSLATWLQNCFPEEYFPQSTTFPSVQKLLDFILVHLSDSAPEFKLALWTSDFLSRVLDAE